MTPARNIAAIVALVAVPGLVGAVVVGPSKPVGRNTRSATGVGHKGLFVTLDHLGWDVQRFGFGLESLPESDVAFVALEPGESLFAEEGRRVSALRTWIAEGRSALITLGPDEDRAAEIDDLDQSLSPIARKATDLADDVGELAPQSPNTSKGASDREKLPNIIPLGRGAESWPAQRVLRFADIDAEVVRLPGTHTATRSLAGPLSEDLGRLAITRPRVFSGVRSSDDLQVLLSIDNKAVVLEKTVDRGRLIVVSEPRLFQNRKLLFEAGHARLAVRLAEHLESRSLLFEEFSHGERSHGGWFDLMKAGWPISLHLVLLLCAMLGWRLFRRRSPLPFEVESRRSKEEFVDSVAVWAQRTADHGGALDRLIELTKHRLSRDWRVATDELPGAASKRGVSADLFIRPAEVNADVFATHAAKLLEVGRRARRPEAGALHGHP